MIKKHQKVALFTSLVGILLFWLTFALLSGLMARSSNSNAEYLPESTNLVIKIDGRKILDQSTRSILLSEDDETLTILRDLIQDKQEDDKRMNLGLDLGSNIFYFEQDVHGASLSGLLLNLLNSRKFEKNIGSLIGTDQVSSNNNEVAVILFKNGEDLSMDDLQVYADKLITKHKVKNYEFNEDAVVSVVSETHSSRAGSVQSNLWVYIENHELRIEGSIAKKDLPKKVLHKKLAPAGFQFSVLGMAENWSDSLFKSYEDFGFFDQAIDGFSMNYNGLEIKEVPSLFLLPKADLLAHFKDTINIRSNLEQLEEAGEIKLFQNYFTYGELNYYFQQIDAFTISIGTSREISLVDSPSNELVVIGGNPSSITSLEGEGMMRKFLEITSIFSSSKKFFSQVEELNCVVKLDGKQNIQGTIRFKKDEFALNSMIQFLIGSNLIK